MTIEEWLGKDNTLGIDIWHKKYQHDNETFEEWLDRVSNNNQKVRQLIKDKKFLFGGRVLTSRGLDNSASYFNCYSRGFVEDNYEDIMKAGSDIGLTFKAQGGQGLSLSKIRPKGTQVGKEYTSDGIIPFMKIYNEITAGTSQGGSRKGALMISLDALHKEAKDFIKIKSDNGIMEKANLSLEVDDRFMEAVNEYLKTGKVVTLHETRNYSGHEIEYDVVPIEVFRLLVDNCYDWGDPACLFTDRFRNYNLMEFDDSYQIETSNPCGEQPLPKHGACCLGSINLSEFVNNPYTDTATFDMQKFDEAVETGVRALDELIDENYLRHPLKQQQEMSFNYRNIGLGVFGYATMLMKLGVKYGSEKARYFTDGLFYRMFRTAVFASNKLAGEKGTFPKYKDVVFDSTIMKKHFVASEIGFLKRNGLRNCSLLSIAPTGSIATFLGESGGCEPEFAIKFTRRTVGMTDGEDKYYDVYCKAAKEFKEKYDANKTLPDYFVSSSDVYWGDRVLTQATIQVHIDTAISSTVNLPNTATKDDIANIYLSAWENGLKGITIFRDGCKKLGILTTDKTPKQEDTELKRGDWKPKAKDTVYYHRKVKIGCGKVLLSIGWSEKEHTIQDFYVKRYGNGGCERLLEATAISMSAIFRLGGSLSNIEKAFDKGIGTCNSFVAQRSKGVTLSKGNSCGEVIKNELKAFLQEMNGQKEEVADVDNKHICPECGAELTFEGGCITCHNCGYSKCG